MKIKQIILLLILLVIPVAGFAQGVQWKHKVEHNQDNRYTVHFEATITPGWHMYDLGPYEIGPNPTIFTFEPSAGLTLDGGIVALDRPHKEFDDVFRVEIGYYDGKARFAQKVRLSGEKAVLATNIEWMICNDTECLPLDDIDLNIEIVKVAEAETVTLPLPVVGETDEEDITAAEDETEEEPVIENPYEESTGEQIFAGAAPEAGGSFWAHIIEAILWGFAALLTPCVFPMVPMTVSFFMKNGGNATAGRFKALMYGFFIVALYTLPIAVIILATWFVGGDAITADIFNWLATHWIPNIIFFLVFMIFAASFFGAFEITLPGWMVNRSDSKSDKKGLSGIFFMALTLVLVSFSCTGPIVGTVLIKSTAGEFWEPIATMFAFSIAFALPFTLCAFFPTLLQKMPKSGGWLNSVKVVLGFIEVALGLKFLSVADQTYHWGLLDREVYLAIWIVVFTLMGFYLLGKIRFAHDSDVKHIGVGRLALVIATFTFVVYLIPGMWGAPLKALSGYLPPMHTQDFVMGSSSANNSSDKHSRGITTVDGRAPKYSDFLHLPHNLQGFFDLEEAEAYAASVNKPIFIDFTGHGCVNCREMEARVWSDPRVLELLRNEYVVVALYADDKKILPEEQWITTESGKVLKGLGKINSHYALTTYGVNAQPYYVLQDTGGNILTQPKGYDLNVQNFLDFLQAGIRAYREKETN